MSRRIFQAGEEKMLKRVHQLFLEAGYASVAHPASKSNSCDFVAYGRKSDGSFGVVAVIEVKSSSHKTSRDLAAPRLVAAMLENNAERGFMITEDEIWEINEKTLSLGIISRIPQLDGGSGVLRDKDLIAKFLWDDLLTKRTSKGDGEQIDAILKSVLSKSWLFSRHPGGLQIEGAAFVEAVSDVFQKFGRISPLAQSSSSSEVTVAIEHLSRLFPKATRLFDPASGVGLTLTKVADSLQKNNHETVSLSGFDINPLSVRIADQLAEVANPLLIKKFEIADLTISTWPECDLLISEPPMGLRLDPAQENALPHMRTIEEYVVFRAAQGVIEKRIEQGAIILTSRGWLGRDSSQPLRDFLAHSRVVRALIGLPGLNRGTSLPLVAVVLVSESDSTVIADLGLDWDSQLQGQVGDLHELLRRTFDK